MFVRQAQLQNAADACRRFRARRFHGLLSRGGAGQREPSTKRCIPGPRYPAPHAEPLLAPRESQSRFLIRPITSTRTRRWTDDRRGAPAFREQGHGKTASWRRHQGYHGKWPEARTHPARVVIRKTRSPEKLPWTRTETEAWDNVSVPHGNTGFVLPPRRRRLGVHGLGEERGVAGSLCSLRRIQRIPRYVGVYRATVQRILSGTRATLCATTSTIHTM